jgi:sirohydrochlorin ferrochelatase
MTGLILFAHGSKIAAANDAVRSVVEKLRQYSEYAAVEPAFLELADPDLPGAVSRLIQFGLRRIVVVPYLLTPGAHLTQDLPGIVAQLRNIYQGVSIEVTESLDGHPALLEAVRDRANQSHGSSGSESKAG